MDDDIQLDDEACPKCGHSPTQLMCRVLGILAISIRSALIQMFPSAVGNPNRWADCPGDEYEQR